MIKIGRTVNGISPPVPPRIGDGRNYRKIDCINVYSGLNLTRKAEFSSLHPDNLRESSGRILGNVWKFSKLYRYIPRIKLTGMSGRLLVDIWKHPYETHFSDDIVTKEYWEWRRKGFNLEYPLVSPIGKSSKERYIGFIPTNCNLYGDVSKENVEILDSVQARKDIFNKHYSRLVKREEKFYELKKWIKNGQNLFIIDPDGPCFEDLEYYKDKYNVDDEFITSNNIAIANEENLKIFLNDELHEPGFSFYLAALLQDIHIF